MSIFFSSFIIALSGALMPGPLLTATISESSRRGFMAGPLLVLGHGILEISLVIALMLGLAPILQQEIVFRIIGVSGGLILLWMAISMYKNLPKLSIACDQYDNRKGALIISGIVLSISNPYWIIWWASIGLGYIIHSMKAGIIGVTLFFVGHILADLIWYTSVSFAIDRGRQLFNDFVYRSIIAVCASFLVFFGGYFIYAGIFVNK